VRPRDLDKTKLTTIAMPKREVKGDNIATNKHTSSLPITPL